MINNNNTPNPGGLLAAQMWLQTYTSSKLQQEHIKQLSIFKTKANWTGHLNTDPLLVHFISTQRQTITITIKFPPKPEGMGVRGEQFLMVSARSSLVPVLFF